MKKKQISQELPEKITLNQLGEEDTIVEITVTAEDGVTEKIYKKIHIKKTIWKNKRKSTARRWTKRKYV